MSTNTNNMLYKKYNITKTDGSPVDPHAMYFVLRLDTDAHARAAFENYIDYIRNDDPAFAGELYEYLRHAEKMSRTPSYSGSNENTSVDEYLWCQVCQCWQRRRGIKEWTGDDRLHFLCPGCDGDILPVESLD